MKEEGNKEEAKGEIKGNNHMRNRDSSEQYNKGGQQGQYNDIGDNRTSIL